jgi:hypothetical protein
MISQPSQKWRISMPFEPYDFFVPVVKITKPTGVSIFNDKYLGILGKMAG